MWTEMIHNLAGPAAKEVGLPFGEKAHAYRLRNVAATTWKAKQKLCGAGISEKPVPPRLLLPIVENSSIEDNEILQNMWAGLLASASHAGDSTSPAFIETLKHLTPAEAQHLEKVASTVLETRRDKSSLAYVPIPPSAFTEKWGAPPEVTTEVYERLGLIRRDSKVVPRQRINFEAVVTVENWTGVDYELQHQFSFSFYGNAFLEACRGPGTAL